jgi:hypothetical protein
MRTLRLILLTFAFAVADAAVPAPPDALEVADEVDEVGHPVTRRDTQEQPLARLPVSARYTPARVTTSRLIPHRVAPVRPVARAPLRKIPVVAEPASAPEDHS